MIFIKAVVNDKKILKKLTVSGHGSFAEKGKDIVCAAVSILIYGLYLSLNTLEDIEIEYNDNREQILLKIKKIENNLEGELRGITLFLITGIKSLLKEYKEYLSFELKEL